MFELDSYAKQFTDMMSDGFIFIDKDGIIQIYNNKAKEIFGIINNYGYSHPAGRVEKGDIVIIGDTCLGVDDGGLTPDHLKCIGIEDRNLGFRDAFIAIGSYLSDKPVLKYTINKHDNYSDKLEMNYAYSNLNIMVCIDFIQKFVKIMINQESYIITFFKSIGHIVVLDGKTNKMKFCQTKGYTVRGESIYDLLAGSIYKAKGIESEFDVIGRNIFEIHKDNETIKDFYYSAKGFDISYLNQYKEINGKPTICSLYPINQGNERVGAVLKIDDMSEFKKVIKERDEALKNLYEIERKLIFEETNILSNYVGDSKEILNVKKLALKASKSNSTVLILGESGTGKSLLAKLIHDNSKIKDKPFITLNCAAIPETLLESELFGYESGAFTGAKNGGKIGLFELAQGGTLFLDEICEMSLFLQAKLLQVLQDKSYYKLGSKQITELDVRIIVATNKNLEEEIQKGRFRDDLYYRINVFPIYIPPLRERKQDIYPLVKSILPKICRRIGCEDKGISAEAVNLLVSHEFHGNIRELENILERAINITEGNTIFSNHLAITNCSIKNEMNNNLRPLREILEEAEKSAIVNALILNNGDKKAAMKLLKIGKTNFYEKIKKYGLE